MKLEFINKRKMSEIYLTSDTHYFHDLLVNLGDRPKNFWYEMTEHMAAIPEDSMLIHCGDICIGQDRRAHAEFLSQVKCTKILVRGNHDNKSDNWYLAKGWDFVCESFVKKASGKTIVFTHIPLTEHNYDLNIHGHFHNNKRFHPNNAEADPSKYFLVAIEENGMRPVKLKTALKKRR